MTIRLLTPFPHQDPAVHPSVQFHAEAPYLPGLECARRAAQEVETAHFNGDLRAARLLTREAVQRLNQFLPRVAGRPRPEDDETRSAADRAAWRAAR